MPCRIQIKAYLRFGWVACLGSLRRLLCPSDLNVGEAELPDDLDQDADADQDVEDREDLDRPAGDHQVRLIARKDARRHPRVAARSGPV